jgi:PKD repeat protein
MKKYLLFLISVLLLVSANISQAGTKTILISGFVKDLNNAPIPNHAVTIISDSIYSQNYFYYKTVTTLSNGLYVDSIKIPDDPNIRLTFNVWTLDCNYQYFNRTVIYNGSFHYTADFTICNKQTPECKADFYTQKDSTINSSQYAYRFSDISRGNNISEWFWDFGDNTISREKNPMHKFEGPGIYNVCLTIFSIINNGSDSCKNTLCKQVNIEGYPNPPLCHASFYYYNYSYGNDTIKPWDSIKPPIFKNTYYFINTSQGRKITKCYWDFGDGSSSYEQNPIHSFNKEGTYKICLTISSVDGQGNYCTDTFCQTITTNPTHQCIADFYLVPDDSISNLAIRFHNISSGDSVKYEWGFGDGGTSNLEDPLYVYQKPGIYNVCLTISNPGMQCYDHKCKQIFAGNDNNVCKAYFTYLPNDSSMLTVMYNYKFYDHSKGNIKFRYWEFGDGFTSNEINPAHIYSKPGYYNVCLTISDSTNAGCFDKYCQMVYIGKPLEYCRANFYFWLDSTVNTPNLYRFNDYSTGRHDKWLWSFGDGESSAEKNPSHQYQKTGIYNVCLIISSDSINCLDSICKRVYVGTRPYECSVKFTFRKDTTVISIPEVTIFRFIPIAPGNVIEYTWDFEDGSISNEKSPLHSFYYGMHKVCLTAVIENDSNKLCTATYCLNVFADTIAPPPPPDNCFNFFTYNIKSFSDTGFVAAFNAYSSPDLIYRWDFGDGEVITAKDNFIIHHFIRSINYHVCLTTFRSDSGDCSFTSCNDVFRKQDSTYLLGSISGQIFAGSNYADKGYAAIVQLDQSGNISFFDVAQIESKGEYHFDHIPYGGYYVFAVLYSGSEFFKKYLPTFYGDTWDWNQATIVGVGDLIATDHIDIHLIPFRKHIKGIGNISGFITDGSFKSAKSVPVSNVEVVLLDNAGNPLIMTYSDNSGYYEFPELDYGTYNIFVEVMGLQTITATVTLTENGSSASNVNFSIDMLKVAPFANISYVTNNSNLGNQYSNIYPDPVTDIANINIIAQKTADVTLNIYSLIGQFISSSAYSLNAGSNKLSLSTSGLDKGIYIVKISDRNHTTAIRRFIRLN